MHKIFGVRPYVEVYLDDIIIHSKTIEDHVEHIEIVSKLLRDANLRLKPSKCVWFAKKVFVLGHVVFGETIEMDPNKIDAVSKRKPPKNTKQLQSFLGLCNYYRKFINDYAKIAAPMFSVLKKDKFEWTNKEEESFENLKQALVSKPILRQPDFTRKFIIYTDASSYAISGVLSQQDEFGKEYVVCFNSRLLKNAEIHYGITEKECLAVVWAIKKYRIYVYGTQFDVVTDHSALKWLINITDPTARLARWSIYLQAYEFNIIHRKGTTNGNADALSRPVLLCDIREKMYIVEDISPKYLDPYDDDNLMYYLTNGKMRDGLSRKQVNRIKRSTKSLNYDPKINSIFIYDKNNKLIEIPEPKLRENIVKQAHEFGHFQIESTLERIKESYYWKKMADDVKKIVSTCIICK